MKKVELVAQVAEQAGITKKAAALAVDSVFDTISAEVAKGEKITLVGFGTFMPRERAARTGRNPKTGETIKIGASKSVGFKAGKGLKDKVNG